MSIKKALQSTSLYRLYDTWHWRERAVSPGRDFPDQIFYVIRRHNLKAGLFSFLATNLGSIEEALQRGMVPVIDMQSSPNPMLTAAQVGNTNAWELFFKQPCGYGLEDVRHAKRVVLSKVTAPEKYPDYRMLGDEESVKRWRELAAKYIVIRDDIREDSQEYYNQVMQGHKVLGVLCRGTDYIHAKPKDHPIQPEVSQVLSDCRDYMRAHHYDMIYLATEDADIWETFQGAFPGRVISYQQLHFRTRENENVNVTGNQLLDPYQRSREYLISISLLARCDSLIAGAAGGTYGALLMTEGYEYTKIYQLGRYE